MLESPLFATYSYIAPMFSMQVLNRKECGAEECRASFHSVCVDYAVQSIAAYCTVKRIKKVGKLNIIKFLEVKKK